MRVLIVSLCILLSHLAQADTPPVVKTRSGSVSGVTAHGVESFKGIPFAAAPIGNLRWRAPQPVSPWVGVRAAHTPGAICMQVPWLNNKSFGTERRDMSEDCLTLDVVRPIPLRTAGAKKLPVMVWIYGGALTTGASSLPTYDGTVFARGGVVFVAINYRVGRLGFFVHPTLVQENADNGRLGNYGLMDQIAALQWVKRNIAAFGGDPNNVTLFGQNAGALSIQALMVSPEARGLFQKAISQSANGSALYRRISETGPDGRVSGEAEGEALAHMWGANAKSLSDLRAIPADQLTDKSDGTHPDLTFYLDGKTLTEDLRVAFRGGREAPVPLLIGATAQEFANNTDPDGVLRPVITAAQEASLEPLYGTRPASIGPLTSDIVFAEPARTLAGLHARNGHPTYLYIFDVVSHSDAATLKAASHLTDLRYVFGTLSTGNKPIEGADEARASETINAQWRAFGRTGTPNAAGLPTWPKYDGKQIMYLHLNDSGAKVDPRSARLDALTALVERTRMASPPIDQRSQLAPAL